MQTTVRTVASYAKQWAHAADPGLMGLDSLDTLEVL